MTDAAPAKPTDAAPDHLTGTEAEVFAVLTDLYDAFLVGDRNRLEAHLAEGCTMWDSTLPSMRTKADLQAGRTAPPAAPATATADTTTADTTTADTTTADTTTADTTPTYPDPVALDATEAAVGLLGPDAAWESHVLLARFDDPALDEQLRCTSVLRRDRAAAGGTWRVVHHHEELIIGPGRGLAVRRPLTDG